MPQTRECDYCSDEIPPGTGTMFVRTDGTTIHYCSSKCEKNAELGREPRDLEWIQDEEAERLARAEEGNVQDAEAVDEGTEDGDAEDDLEEEAEAQRAEGDADDVSDDVEADGDEDAEDAESDGDAEDAESDRDADAAEDDEE